MPIYYLRISTEYPNGVVTTYEYNEINVLARQVSSNSDGEILESFEYTIGDNGERLSCTELGRTVEYSYDELQRLISETVITGEDTSVTTYSYDSNSNRISMDRDGEVTTYEYNELNQITRAGDVYYIWDNAGNLITQSCNGITAATYSYDSRNRMVSASVLRDTGILEESYTYDYLGNRTSKTSDGKTTYFTTDLSSGYSQVLKAETSTETIYYVRGFELISRRTGSEASYYLFDGGMSVRGITDEEGNLTDTLVFDAFGNEAERTGTTDSSYGFQGEEQDETGLYYLRARYMDPTTGTFTSMDTYGGSLSEPMSLHKYLFANSNPVKYCDPSGHSASLGEFALAMGMQAIIGAELNGIFYVFGLNCGEISQPCNNTFFYFDLANQMLKGALLGVIFTAMYMIASVFLVTRIVSYVLLIVGGFTTWSNASDDLWSGNLDRQQRGMLEFALGTFMIGSGIFGLGREFGFGSANGKSTNIFSNQNNGNDPYNEAEWLAKYIDKYGELPEYYIEREDAINNGFVPRDGNLDLTNPGRVYTGGVYRNSNGALPSSPNRVYYEADINYSGGFRGSDRLVYSNDGLYFVTTDHYQTFTQIFV